MVRMEAFELMNNLKIIKISNNLGDSRSLITHPATTTHSNIESKEQLELDITSGMCRLSVGIENVDDLIKDLERSLKNFSKLNYLRLCKRSIIKS